jgi:hypothetical protein
MESTKRIKLLITGIPGTGKTTFGNFLKDNFDFIHYDFEKILPFMKISQIGLNPRRKNNLVITWGFVPIEDQIIAVEKIRSDGFQLVWFDGDRVSALKAFADRNTVSREAFDRQIVLIEESKVIQRIKPIVINTFDEAGAFKNLNSIYQEIIARI